MASIQSKYLTFDRHVFSSKQTTKNETAKHFLGKLSDLTKNCNLEMKGETVRSYVFSTNHIDADFQRELLKETIKLRNTYQTTNDFSQTNAAIFIIVIA